MSWLLKYWPLFLFVVTMTGSAGTFYVSMHTVTLDVNALKIEQPKYVKTTVMDLRLRLVDNRADHLEDTVDENEDRSTTQFEKIDDKLDKIQQLIRELGQ